MIHISLETVAIVEAIMFLRPHEIATERKTFCVSSESIIKYRTASAQAMQIYLVEK